MNLKSVHFDSTETAVLKVLADILLALDTGDIAVLTLLDLSAAFDTVDHATLLRRLETSYGIGSTVLGWFASYLSKNIQTARCSMSASDASAVLCGDHKDRSLDRFCSYSTLRTYCDSLRVTICVHTCTPTTRRSTASVVQQQPHSSLLQQQVSVCSDDVALWMQSNLLQLNTAKTKVLWCASSRRQHQLPQVALKVSTDYVTPKTSVCDLGIYVDSDVSMWTTCPGPCPAASPHYARCAAFVGRRHKRYYCRWSSRWCCHAWTMATRRSPVYLATSPTRHTTVCSG